jgi:hypothetical protein
MDGKNSNAGIQDLYEEAQYGLVGYGFMGRAHSNAYLSVSQFSILNVSPYSRRLRRGIRKS